MGVIYTGNDPEVRKAVFNGKLKGWLLIFGVIGIGYTISIIPGGDVVIDWFFGAIAYILAGLLVGIPAIMLIIILISSPADDNK